MSERLKWLYNPSSKPAKELSEHDQKMIRLGWDAKKTFSEQKKLESPDREKITNIIAYWIANERHGFGDVEESDWNNLSLCEKQSIWQNAKDIVDQIIALIPDIEEKQEWYDKLLAEFKTLKRERASGIEDAREQERERVKIELSGFAEMLKRAPEMHGDIQSDPLKTQEFLIWWQALKNNKEENIGKDKG